MWIIATVALSSDVRSAVLDDAGRHVGWREAVAWVQSRVGRPVALMPVHDALTWRIDEGGQRRWPDRQSTRRSPISGWAWSGTVLIGRRVFHAQVHYAGSGCCGCGCGA